MTLRSSLPLLRRGLVKHRLGDEVLIYDAAIESIHLLDGTTARVAESLDQGRDEIDIVAELEVQPGSGAGDSLLALALDELSKADLIEYSQPPLPMTDVTRRQLLQKLAAVGAGLVIPMVLSLTPSSAGAASVCGQSCGSNSSICTPIPGCACCAKPISGFPDHTCAPLPFTVANCHGSP
jgi:hypothetical protein